SAEMHNQAINSLAFISTRYTATAVDLTLMMCASYLYVVCQALDLRVLQLSFFQSLEPLLYAVNHQSFGPLLSDHDFDELHVSIWDHVRVTWLMSANKDFEERYSHVVDSTVGIIVNALLTRYPSTGDSSAPSPATIATIPAWKASARRSIAEAFTTVRNRVFEKPETAAFLGLGSRTMYTYVREKLKVPLHQGLKDNPEPHDMPGSDGSRKRTIGSNIATIYQALRSGAMHQSLVDCVIEEESSDFVDLNIKSQGWQGFSNGAASTTSGRSEIKELRNVHNNFGAGPLNGEPEPMIVEAKRRHSVSLGEINGHRRRSLATMQGSLTCL
ncbi:MAG: hypothetical protein Q9174_006243, partial [Haloplaca sp. 1 TL-2023]